MRLHDARAVRAMTASVISMPASPVTIDDYGTLIDDAWRSSVAGILRTAQLLADARAALDDDGWRRLIEGRSFGMRTAQMLRKVGEKQALFAANHGSLPASWRTLAELATWTEPEIQVGLAHENLIRPDMERSDVAEVRRRVRAKLGGRSDRRPATRAPAKRTPFLATFRSAIAPEIESLDALGEIEQRVVVTAARIAIRDALKSLADGRVLADMPADDFERGLADAKADGDLSVENILAKASR
jgi:hypothetical protein